MIKLYYAPRTRAVRILWLLEALGLPYILERVDFVPPARHFFAQRTPLGKLPTIEDGDIVMCESGAIVEDARARAAMGFDFLQRELGGKPYVLGAEFSAADIMLAFTLVAARALGVLDDRYPTPKSYLARLEARPAFQKTIAVQ